MTPTESTLSDPTSTSTFETIVVPTSTSDSSSAEENSTVPEAPTSTESLTTETMSAAEITTEFTTESAPEHTTEPTTEPTAEPTVETTTESSTEPSTEPTPEPPSEPVIETTTESLIPSTTETPAPTSELFTTTSGPPCEPTITTWAPELCWRFIPARCSSMKNTALAAPTITAHINACNTNLRTNGNELVSEVSSCFADVDQPDFNPISAYNCISNAPIFCQTTSTCAPAATSTPTAPIPAFDNTSFESGTFGSWKETPTTPGNFLTSISMEQAHSGSYSLKMVYNNLADDFISFEHRIKFEPRARYEFSFWYYHLFQHRGTLSINVEYSGTSLLFVIQMANQGVGRWINQKFSLTPSTSFGTFSVGYIAQKGTMTGGDTIYIDDVTFTKL